MQRETSASSPCLISCIYAFSDTLSVAEEKTSVPAAQQHRRRKPPAAKACLASFPEPTVPSNQQKYGGCLHQKDIISHKFQVIRASPRHGGKWTCYPGNTTAPGIGAACKATEAFETPFDTRCIGAKQFSTGKLCTLLVA